MREPSAVAGPWRDARREVPQVWALSWPVMASGIVQLLLPIVDTVLLGRVSGTALAALGVAGPVYVLCTMVLYGAGLAVKVVTTRRHGAGRAEEVRKVADVGLACTVALGAGVAGVLLLVSGPLTALLAPSPAVAAQAGDYLRISAAALPVLAVAVTLLSLFGGMGRTRVMLAYALLLGGVNLGLGVALVFGAGMGVRGAALATVVASACGSAFTVAYGRRRVGEVRFGRWGLHPAEWRATAGTLWRFGWPEVVLLCLGFFSPVLLVAMLGGRGEIAVAGYRVVENLFMVLFTVVTAYHSGVMILVGQSLGAGQQQRVQAVRRAGLLLVGATGVLAAAPLLSAPAAVVRAIAPDEAVVAAAAPALPWIVVAIVAAGAASVVSGILRASGDVRYLMVTELGGEYLLVLPVTWLLAVQADLGLAGLGMGWVAGWTAIFAVQLRRCRAAPWHRLQV